VRRRTSANPIGAPAKVQRGTSRTRINDQPPITNHSLLLALRLLPSRASLASAPCLSECPSRVQRLAVDGGVRWGPWPRGDGSQSVGQAWHAWQEYALHARRWRLRVHYTRDGKEARSCWPGSDESGRLWYADAARSTDAHGSVGEQARASLLSTTDAPGVPAALQSWLHPMPIT